MFSQAASLSASWVTTVQDTMTIDDPSIRLPHLTLQTLIGISVAIAGNVLISLALNIQKLAHLRLDRQHRGVNSNGARGRGSRSLVRSGLSTNGSAAASSPGGIRRAVQEDLPLETQPLIHPRSCSVPPTSTYGSRLGDAAVAGDDSWSRKSTNTGRVRRPQRRRTFAPRLLPLHLNFGISSRDPVQDSSLAFDSTPITVDSSRKNGCHKYPTSDGSEGGNEGDYLRSRLWWLGFVLMNVGETGNFISYGFAPASIVAPLGTFALAANCFFAPLMLDERFRSRDLLGILLAVIGASTVVLSSPSSNGATPVLTADALLAAMTQRSFVVFSIVYVILAVILGVLSEGPVGKQIVVVDVGLCAVFGGFTVLSTKAISTLLTKEWANMLAEWITYPILVVLVLTGVLQIRYLNRALRRFDSKIVMPTQFVLFTLSAVVGSAVLYGDFRRATFHQMVTFLYGCAATFMGVYVIARGQSGSSAEGGSGEDAELGHEEEGEPVPGDESGGNGAVESGRPRASTLNIVGYSPVRHLLLVKDGSGRSR